MSLDHLIGTRVTCPHCAQSLRFGIIAPEPEASVIVNPACPACGKPVPLPIGAQ